MQRRAFSYRRALSVCQFDRVVGEVNRATFVAKAQKEARADWRAGRYGMPLG